MSLVAHARRAERWLRAASALTLVALACFVWSLLDPRPIPVILAMSVGQAIGSLAFLIYLRVIARDLRRARVLAPPPRGPGERAP